jgi:hypothetical protein
VSCRDSLLDGLCFFLAVPYRVAGLSAVPVPARNSAGSPWTGQRKTRGEVDLPLPQAVGHAGGGASRIKRHSAQTPVGGVLEPPASAAREVGAAMTSFRTL